MNVGVILGREARALWSEGRGRPLLAVSFGWSLLVGTRMIYPVVLPSLQVTYGLSLTVAGLLVTVLWLCGALGQLPGGVLADEYEERTILAVSASVVALALVLVVTSRTPVVLFAATALWGLGHSLYPIARITFLSVIYPDRLGSGLGVTMAMGDVGQTVLPPVATVLTVAIAWQIGLGFMVPLLVLSAALIYIAVPADAATESPVGTRSLEGARAVFGEMRTPAMGFIMVILFLSFFMWQSFTAFYPTYLMTVKGLSPSLASGLFGLFFAVGVVIKPVAGAAYDRIGLRGTLVIGLTPAVAGFGLLPFVDGFWPLVVITAFISTMLCTGTITQSYVAESFSEELRGTGLGVVRTTTATLGASGPVLLGVVADFGYFDEAYLALAAVMLAVILLTLRMPQT